MNSPVDANLIKDSTRKKPQPGTQLVLGLIFGVIFGFLLQKSGVAKYEVLMGSLLLTDFTVFKVMLAAIITGMIGIFSMHALGMVKLHIKPTKYAANIIGGLIFGIGMAIFGYCPGTGSAALGQGNYDALVGIFGLMAGSYVYAEMSGYLEGTILKWGDKGKIMLPEIIGMKRVPFIILFSSILVLALALMEFFFS